LKYQATGMPLVTNQGNSLICMDKNILQNYSDLCSEGFFRHSTVTIIALWQ